MEVKLLAHSKLVDDVFLIDRTGDCDWETPQDYWGCTDGQVIALTAIRTCYSHNNPSEIVELEGEKYFGSEASDGKSGTDADRLLRHIVNSGHTSTMEHLNFTFAIEGISRSLLAQLTRHRHFSYSVQSQRYNKLETTSKSGGFDYVIPASVEKNDQTLDMYSIAMERIQDIYDDLRKYGVPAEDARYILPNAATCNLVLTGNLRSILDFYGKRSAKQAQWEIRELAEKIKGEVVNAECWTEQFFGKGE
ncbi:FAD-dependent thymidylate synthase [Bacillus sp. DTU_2020_1000418_1_SI_GHA_SEK_038]|uniref:FAD-dependent thymidylate synthase n=1 Tax=Bacillus sp. DTU_2020_1000418_1_SI_GHA_SEK_038 TaxID=3077585 RepID=UPI0028F14D67|nr:FAD-dependent thymidylate synthase [Bacillus sp. DTU_2020_1000418_1_SI_GHA_SEK_038]WNS74253.1 FAD-dependent thymidylate synthase [Bacillus sp. DTU_2020_1000418_1_SI_GHA_SEK_038]